ncbi:MAG: hypothetical protein FWH20_07580 [Oscillospiraceae bacterium]|nr:hypothetical protein [Oscillospiraceae bacterium]
MRNSESFKKYVKAYKIAAAVTLFGIPTIVGSFIGVSIFIGVTAFLVAEKIGSVTGRVCFYAGSLGLTAGYIAVNIGWFLTVSRNPTTEAMSPILGMTAGAVVILGLGGAFVTRGFLWWNRRRFEAGKIRGVYRR